MRTFSDGIHTYSVDMMFAYINLFNPKVTEINPEAYQFVLDYKGWGLWNSNVRFSPKDVLASPKKYKYDYDRIMSEDLKYPIIISNGNIVDGVHRLTRATMLKKTTMRAYIFPNDLLEKFRINSHDVKEYQLIELFHKQFCSKKALKS